MEIREESASDASGPGANGCVSAAIGVQNRQGVGGARLGSNRDEHSAAAEKGFVNPAVVRLKSDAPHRGGNAQLSEVARASLKGVQQPAVAHDRADARDVETPYRSR